MTATVCEKCKARLAVEGSVWCHQCWDRAILERQRAGDQADLGAWS
jgi:uncharacterized Zn finger protein (UPF0148 family)